MNFRIMIKLPSRCSRNWPHDLTRRQPRKGCTTFAKQRFIFPRAKAWGPHPTPSSGWSTRRQQVARPSWQSCRRLRHRPHDLAKPAVRILQQMRITRGDVYEAVKVTRRIAEPRHGARHLPAAPTVIRLGVRVDEERGEKASKPAGKKRRFIRTTSNGSSWWRNIAPSSCWWYSVNSTRQFRARSALQSISMRGNRQSRLTSVARVIAVAGPSAEAFLGTHARSTHERPSAMPPHGSFPPVAPRLQRPRTDDRPALPREHRFPTESGGDPSPPRDYWQAFSGHPHGASDWTSERQRRPRPARATFLQSRHCATRRACRRLRPSPRHAPASRDGRLPFPLLFDGLRASPLLRFAAIGACAGRHLAAWLGLVKLLPHPSGLPAASPPPHHRTRPHAFCRPQRADPASPEHLGARYDHRSAGERFGPARVRPVWPQPGRRCRDPLGRASTRADPEPLVDQPRRVQLRLRASQSTLHLHGRSTSGGRSGRDVGRSIPPAVGSKAATQQLRMSPPPKRHRLSSLDSGARLRRLPNPPHRVSDTAAMGREGRCPTRRHPLLRRPRAAARRDSPTSARGTSGSHRSPPHRRPAPLPLLGVPRVRQDAGIMRLIFSRAPLIGKRPISLVFHAP